MRDKKGFTLIELLVVIAIIGLLSTIAVISLNISRTKARDTRRLADIRQIMTSLEVYFDDKLYYPNISNVSTNEGGWSNLDGLLSPYLSSKLPIDPKNDSTYFYAYSYNSNLNQAELYFRLERGNPDAQSSYGWDPGNEKYHVYLKIK